MQSEQPKKLNIDPSAFTAILEAVKACLTASQYEIIESAFDTLAWLLAIIKAKDCSIAKLKHLVFGRRTNSLKNLKELAKEALESDSHTNQPTDVHLTEGSTDKTEETPTSDEEPILKNSEPDFSSDVHSEEKSINTPEEISSSDKKTPLNNEESSEKEPVKPIEPEPKKKKNHGRRSLDEYNVTNITHILCGHLKPGDICPECKEGKLYGIEPQIILTITGSDVLKGKAHTLEGFRCNRCMHIFRAVLPKKIATQPKADFFAKASVCLQKYQLGVPLYRLETWLKIQGLPISDAEMWEWTEEVALVLLPIHQALMNIAADSKIIHNDDTSAKILDLMKENTLIKKEEAKNLPKKKDKQRVGIYTTILLAKQGDHDISIYVTGRKNAGENLDELLDKRSKNLAKPVQACDASSDFCKSL